MSSTNANTPEDESRIEQESRNQLDQIVKEGAQRMLAQALENEVEEYIQNHKHVTDENDHRKVVRNGHKAEREIQTAAGNLDVQQPRIDDQREGETFTSNILPPYMRRTPTVNKLIPALYLKGISTGDMSDALEAILGKNAKGLSSTNVTRLKESWEEEYKEWENRDLSDREYVYFWVDGIYFNVRLTDDRPCMLVIMGARKDGSKELVAVHEGVRESKISWKESLLDLKNRGLQTGPKLVVGDGALGFWAALEEVYPESKQQRCWVHKKKNILNKLPKSVHGQVKDKLNEIKNAPNKEEALTAVDTFEDLFGSKYPKAFECLNKDRENLLTFYDFPSDHWTHLRTTNPIESTFATVRHRTRQTKGCGSRVATRTMVFKLTREAEKHWRRLNGSEHIDKVIRGVQFKDGEEVTETPLHEEQEEEIA